MVNPAHINSVQSIFFGISPFVNINGCQVPSRFRAWFQDSADDIDFYQICPGQSESTILHESIIYIYSVPKNKRECDFKKRALNKTKT